MRTSKDKIEVGAMIPPRELEAIDGSRVAVPDSELLTHLQFRRFASCPFCNLHLRSIQVRHDEISAAGIREVVLFYSTADELRRHQPDMPFAIVADPDRELYAEFGVGSSITSGIHPRALGSGLRGMLVKRPGTDVRRGPLGLPADFLIDTEGHVVARKYGELASDQWSVDELLEQVPAATH